MGIIQSQTVMPSLRLCDKKKPVRSFERTGFFSYAQGALC